MSTAFLGTSINTSVFKIDQKMFFESESGYVELLIVHNSPSGFGSIIVHKFQGDEKGGCFVECKSYIHALIVFKAAQFPGTWYDSTLTLRHFFYNPNQKPWFYSETINIPYNKFILSE